MVTGEQSMSAFMAEKDMELRGGQRVRLLELFADAGKGLGSLDYVRKEYPDAEAFVQAIDEWSNQNQGVAAEAFLMRVTADLPYANKNYKKPGRRSRPPKWQTPSSKSTV